MSTLDDLSNEELASAVRDLPAGYSGATGVVDLGNGPLFVKRVPVTDVEFGAERSTRNHFALPLFYSYGVGSLGFGAWRELAALELAQPLRGFPQLLHHRILERPDLVDRITDLDAYVHRWNDNHAVRRYCVARAAARYELCLVMEHLPTSAFDVLLTTPGQVEVLVGEVLAAARELRGAGICHFDLHLGNVVSDGTRFRVVDFGLAMAASFELDGPEREFLDRHRLYDVGTALASLGMFAAGALGHAASEQSVAAVIEGTAPGVEAIDAAWRATLQRLRAPILYMVRFFDEMRRPQKDARYDDGHLAALLEAAGVSA